MNSLLQYSLIILLLITKAVSVTASIEDASWLLVKDKQGVKLYTAIIDGSDYVAVKAVTQIDASMETLVAVLGDGEGCNQWRELCQSSRVLQTLPDRERTIYMVLNMPWPLADRDMVIHSRATLDTENKAFTVNFSSAQDSYPMQDYIRAISQGKYHVRVTSEQQLEFSMVMHTELGGNLSPSIINGRLVENTLADVTRLVMIAEQ
jgi:hypothetical protein